jgi:hypothetical protein
MKIKKSYKMSFWWVKRAKIDLCSLPRRRWWSNSKWVKCEDVTVRDSLLYSVVSVVFALYLDHSAVVVYKIASV